MSHTPGPWVLRHRRSVFGADTTLVADVNMPVGSDIRVDSANANLIVAAPVLLEALRKINTWLVSPDTTKESMAHFKSVCEEAIGFAVGK